MKKYSGVIGLALLFILSMGIIFTLESKRENAVPTIQNVKSNPTVSSSPTVQNTIPTVINSPTIIPTKIITVTPTKSPIPTKKANTPIPTKAPVVQTQSTNTTTNDQPSSIGACNCSLTCEQLSCAEAQFQLNSCGCGARDRDKDGVACDAQCQ